MIERILVVFNKEVIDNLRDRRSLIQFEDGIHQGLRALLRQLEQLRQNLELQRAAVERAIKRVDLTSTEAPAQEELGPTTALNLLSAIDALRDSQNNFMSVWLNHYATRMRLMRELGIMQLDGHGMWIDSKGNIYLAGNATGITKLVKLSGAAT